MTDHRIHTEADLDAGLAASAPPIRASSRSSPRPGGRRCGGGPTVSPGLPRRWCRSSSRPRAPARSGDGSPRPSIRSSRRRSSGRGRRGWPGSACRRRRSARSRKSPARRQRRARAGDARRHRRRRGARGAHRVHGIGPWTADIYLLACLGHADAWPAGDLALQEAARLAFGLQARPTAKEMMPLAEPWRPWRAVAARVLWSYYRAVKGREGAPRPCRKDIRQTRREMAAELDGPRLEPRSGTARQLVVFLHGYGADGNDLIDIGRAWQQHLPQAAFVSPHAPEPCGASAGRPAMVSADHSRSGRALDRRQQGRAGARAVSRCRAWRATSCRRRRWRWSASARAR